MCQGAVGAQYSYPYLTDFTVWKACAHPCLVWDRLKQKKCLLIYMQSTNVQLNIIIICCVYIPLGKIQIKGEMWTWLLSSIIFENNYTVKSYNFVVIKLRGWTLMGLFVDTWIREHVFQFILHITKVNKYFVGMLNSWNVIPTNYRTLNAQRIKMTPQ